MPRKDWVILGLLCLLLVAPVLVASFYLGELGFLQVSAVLFGAVIAVLCLWASCRLPAALGVLTVFLIGGFMLLTRWAYLGNVRFSGAGFSDEFFAHLHWSSVVAAWHMYGLSLFLMPVLFLVVLLAMTFATLRMNKPGRAPAVVIVLVAPFFWWAVAAQQPETELIQQARSWYGPAPEVPELSELQARWRGHPLVEVDLLRLRDLSVRAPQTPDNLILVYLESVGSSVINHPDWPEIMPYLASLERDYTLVDNFHTSSFITIEGIVNSQCGTLFPFDRGSDSLANGNNLAEQLPCMGDILQRAGYDNYYLGGADIDFAGKGDFLRAHGYPDPMGIRHWREQGLDQRPDTWGLSDADLFDQARHFLQERRESDQSGQPFALTLLTIGTHLPGFVYSECQPYPGSDATFINALHCTDQLLQRWLQKLADDSLLDNTLVVITADHHIFSNPEMHNLFGEAAVRDRRLPLIVLGSDRRAGQHWGALYDLAPTVLDLLEIEHNARFALGRSLLAPGERPYFALDRYRNVYRGEVSTSHGSGCRQPSAVEVPEGVPLNTCQKADLKNLLQMQIRAMSFTRGELSCDPPARVVIPEDIEQPLSIWLSGEPLPREFTRNGRPISATEAGLYWLQFDRTGAVEAMQYVPARQAADLRQPASPSTRVWLYIWRTGEAQADTALPDWLPSLGDGQGVLFGYGDREDLQWQLVRSDPGQPLDWTLSSALCEAAL